MTDQRSGCPINLTLETLGDRWSLIVIRDIMFGNRRHFRELLDESEEGIASNILADRLKRLVAARPAHQGRRSEPQAEGDLQPDREGDPARAPARPYGRLGPPPSAGDATSCRSAPSCSRRAGRTLWDDFMDELRPSISAPAGAGRRSSGERALRRGLSTPPRRGTADPSRNRFVAPDNLRRIESLTRIYHIASDSR